MLWKHVSICCCTHLARGLLLLLFASRLQQLSYAVCLQLSLQQQTVHQQQGRQLLQQEKQHLLLLRQALLQL